jgi:hypothetical protein
VYDVDARDRVVELDDVPPSSAGAPLPVVVADEYTAQLAYFAAESDPDWDGTNPRSVGLADAEPVVLVKFDLARAWFHGPPNDEAFEGHPLAARGLRPYCVFRIDESSWVRRLERMNAVHPRHRPEAFAELKHYVFAFHDSTFECIARGFTASLVDGPLARVAKEMVRALQAR